MTLEWTEGRRLRVLDFDIENRPLAYLGPDYTTAEITAIAWGWWPRGRIECRVYDGSGPAEYRDMLEQFVEAYNQSDIVTGHYIRKHDFPIINSALLEMGLPGLSQKMTSDTKVDLTKQKYLSMSQENLAEALGVKANKFHMNNAKWREANRFTPRGLELTHRRARDDVRQHRQMRSRLVELGVMRPPRLWVP